VSIAEVISAHVALRKAGRSLVGLCPFHGEHTPSFSVNVEGGFFHCFGCGVGGNVFTFLTRIEGISFPEAVRRLAAKAGVSLPQTERDPRAQERARLYRLNEMAATYFQRCLWGNVGGAARQYLETRGISKEIAERFRLGFAPPWGEGLARFLATQQADIERAIALGLVGKRDKGRCYDKFRHRLMFPITDVLGRIIGFGGRLLPVPQQSSETAARNVVLPKYLNSPDSALYKKGTSLYGLFQAKAAIQRQGRVLVVEGYIDLLALVQAGYAETVAVLGTALGREQLELLPRSTGTREVYIFFDGDEAGRRAATRAFPLCVAVQLRGRGVFLQEHDPDTFIREHGPTQLTALIDQAEPLEEFYFARHMPPPGASALQRAQAVKEAVAVLQPLQDVVVRGALLTQIAQRFGINEEEVRRITTEQEASRGLAQIRERQKPVQDVARMNQGMPAAAETELLQLLLLTAVSHCALLRRESCPRFVSGKN
jgi:DNA primase